MPKEENNGRHISCTMSEFTLFWRESEGRVHQAETPSRLRSEWTTVNGLSIHFRVGPVERRARLPVLVLVHGLGVSSRYMMPTGDRLAADYPTYLLDLPGFGRSDKPPHVLTIPQLADALVGWMDAIGIERATLIGNSMGCQTIVDFGVRYPSRIDRAVLVGASVDPKARSVLKQVGRGLLDLLREPFSYWPILTFDYLIAGPTRTWTTLRYAVDDPIADKLPHLQAPTLIVRGERDPIAPQEWAETMQRLAPQARLVVLPGVAHVANYSAPDELERSIRTFLCETVQSEIASSSEQSPPSLA